MVTLAWLLFKLPNFSQVILYAKAVFANRNLVTNYISIFLIFLYSLPVVVYHIMYLREQLTPPYMYKMKFAVYGIMLFLIITNSGTPGAFIYFQF